MRLFRWLLPVALICAAALLFGSRGMGGDGGDLLAGYDPCAEPLSWRIGEVDGRFGISNGQLIEAVRAAVDVWEEPTGLDLFRYDPAGEMPIHLTFDHRQQEFVADEGRRAELRSLEEALSREQTVYDRHRSDYERSAADYEREGERVNGLVRAYNERVAAWNEEGGAPPAEHRRLEEQAQRIAREQESLRARGASLEALGREVDVAGQRLSAALERYNTRVDELRAESPGRLVNSANFRIETVSRGGRVESTRSITIYQYSTYTHLILVLAHELGHALDLEHVAHPLAVMREEHTLDQLAGAVRLQEADLEALRERCGRSVP